ncbi:chromosome partitioning protein (plasmid) [Terribacillus saccharophilus]|uniref:Chromosome partitioning protein n=1 Tax=Terribacillus saccharophilus TaxID=361277 RepID=A0A075LNY7_9BACI|nr:ParA family protein [Terribacillus goriensis]AIF68425.1 chromosome partitioning protein [Terribacillus goriensis]
MGTTISFGIQKGGVGKTTTTAITSYLLSEMGYKTLAVDFDSQGNLTGMLTQRNIYDFTDHTVLQAVKEKDAAKYIHNVSENLDILPAEDFLALLPQFLHREYKGKPATVLRETLEPVKDQYDFILIDLPPNLGDHTINGLTASDYAVVMLQSEPFCYDALERYLEFLQGVKTNANDELMLGGILTTMLDSRATLDNSILDQAKEDYGDLLFASVIKRRSRIKEFTIEGIQNRLKNDQVALEPYKKFIEELIQRVN